MEVKPDDTYAKNVLTICEEKIGVKGMCLPLSQVNVARGLRNGVFILYALLTCSHVHCLRMLVLVKLHSRRTCIGAHLATA